MVGKITYSFEPAGWSQSGFLENGGFSVVFLNYNKMPYIGRAVKSVLSQECYPCEMFFMDDASTDGSGDVMEEMVRAYEGPHKVTVVRNSTNARISGQWNIVSRMATGNWLGMFCADDFAWPDRVSKAAEIVSAYPTLLGFMTGLDEIRVCNGESSDRVDMPHPARRIFADSATSLYQIADFKMPIVGATAWYHRSLFDKLLPIAPLDDLLLRWVLQARAEMVDGPVWLWAGDVKAVTYTSGVGVSTCMQSIKQVGNATHQWIQNVHAMQHFDGLLVKSWAAVLSYYRANGAPRICFDIAQWGLLINKIICGGTCRRIYHLFPVIRLMLIGRIEPAAKKKLIKIWLKFTLQFLFGVRVAAVISVMVKGRCPWK